MGTEYQISQLESHMRVEIFPTITWEGILDCYRQLAQLCAGEPIPRIWIFPNPMPPEVASEFSFSRMRELTELGFGTLVTGRAAIVAENDFFFGKTRQQLSLHPETADRFGVFRTESDALAWLGLDAGQGGHPPAAAE